MARISRTTWLKTAALVVAFASLTINFGLIDLIDGFTGYVDQARNQILDVGWGAVFGVILPLGLLTQLRRPERRVAGIQQRLARAMRGRGRRSYGPLSPWRRPPGRERATKLSPQRFNSTPRDSAQRRPAGGKPGASSSSTSSPSRSRAWWLGRVQLPRGNPSVGERA
jgi:hypothetical protein